jgi:hypothetical protein
VFNWFSSKPKPLRLLAQSEADIEPLSALMQDAALRGEDISFDSKARALTLKFNRFVHERPNANPLRVQSALQIGSVTAIKSRGINLDKPPRALVLLSLGLIALEPPSYQLSLIFAGQSTTEIRLDLECIDILFMDLAPAHRARSVPRHNL